MSEYDWLEGETAQDNKDKQRQRGLEILNLYRVFVETERGRALLAFWDERLLYKRTPPDASIQEYAADEAVRDFVAGIHKQINLLKQLDPRAP